MVERSGAGEVQQRRTGQALGLSVRRRRRGKRKECVMRQHERKGHSLRAWEEEWRRAIFGRSVCTLHFSTNDERLIPTNGLAWCRHARPVWGRKSGCTVYLVVVDVLHALHDLSIGWEGVLEVVVNGLYYLIIVLRSLCTSVGVHNSRQRKAAALPSVVDRQRAHTPGGREICRAKSSLAFLSQRRAAGRLADFLERGLSPSQRDGEEEVQAGRQGLRDREGHA